ncbi:MAG: TetR/AcrR family transcriptional regulator [Polyangiaceae bacterium]
MTPAAKHGSEPRGTTRSDQKERTHERIIDSAARLLRASGIGRASVTEVMKGAGLTVGGFYAHFASKSRLVEETIRHALADQRRKVFRSAEGASPEERLNHLFRVYLSRTHRDHPEEGCPLPAVVSEIAQAERDERSAFVAELDVHLSALEDLADPSGMAGMDRRTLALGLLCMLYGGLSLARATKGTELSDEILKAARAFARSAVGIKGSPAPHAPSKRKK